jgi:hypothetical protein
MSTFRGGTRGDGGNGGNGTEGTEVTEQALTQRLRDTGQAAAGTKDRCATCTRRRLHDDARRRDGHDARYLRVVVVVEIVVIVAITQVVVLLSVSLSLELKLFP